MKRIKELIDDVKRHYPCDSFFENFQSDCNIDEAKRVYIELEDCLSCLDTDSWTILKNKAIKQFPNHREGQRKQGFFDILNEAKAYSFLKKSWL